jgi:SSS family solute:Na+ symporter
MNLHWIDWTIVVLLLGALLSVTLYTKRYTKSIADFLAANRLAGRYLLTVSYGLVGGAISIIAVWEMVYKNGLPTQWWAMMNIPLGLFIALTGFVVYRYRQTRALTMAQFFEVRYSRRFRFFAGLLCWTSGIFNYGIFPAITARFILYYFGFPAHFVFAGITFSSFPLIMLAYLSLAVYIACAGGQISIMLTDFMQGILMMIVFVVIMFFLLHAFKWGDLVAGMQTAPANQSMLNPFKTSQATDFSIWYFLIGLFGQLYGVLAWQGSSGYNAAARTPHEARMANIISLWRQFASNLCMMLIPLAAYAVMHLPAFAATAAPIQATLDTIADPMTRGQMAVPIFLSHFLPVGLIGLFAVIILAAAISCDDTYIHAWGSIFIQDIVLPLRKKPLEPKQHLLYLRLAIIGVAVFGFTFSMLFPIRDFIFMYFALTGAIYLGGAGSVIIGGLYWKRGTTAAAWTALIVGTVLAFGGMLIQTFWATRIAPFVLGFWPDWAWVLEHRDKFPINGQIIYFFAMITAIASYILVSLLGPRRIHDMDKLLHRGIYAVQTDIATGDGKGGVQAGPQRWTWGKLIGITSEFTRFDRFIAKATFLWSMAWWGIFLVGTILCVVFGDRITDGHWSAFWWLKLVAFSVVLGLICTTWIMIGGIRDAIRLFKDLRSERVDVTDDGFVAREEKPAPPKS